MPTLVAETSAASLRMLLLRLEACWWMLRPPGFYVKSSIAAAGWLAATHHPGYALLAAIIVALSLAGGVVNVANDILDRKKDAVTAPELPLPSGIVTLPWALGLLVTLAFGVLAGMALASQSIPRFLIGIAPLIGAVGIVGAYSLGKPVWVGPPLLAATIYTVIPLDAWIVAGAGGHQVIPIFAFTCCFGFSANFLAALRDAVNDPIVGNRTVAVRFGVSRTLLAAGFFDVACAGWAVVAAVVRGNLAAVAPWAAATALIVATGYAWAWQRRAGIADGRNAGLVALRPANFARWTVVVLLIAAFSLPVALVLSAVMALSFALFVPAYRRRIMRGELRTAMLGWR